MYSKLVEVEVDKANQTDGKMNVNDSNVRLEHSNRMDIDDEVQNGTREVEADHQNDMYVKLPEGDQTTAGVKNERHPLFDGRIKIIKDCINIIKTNEKNIFFTL